MDAEEFKRLYPWLTHRLIVPKEPRTYPNLPKYLPKSTEVRVWLEQNIGPKGRRWQSQFLADPDNLVYWFAEEKDLIFTKLKWA